MKEFFENITPLQEVLLLFALAILIHFAISFLLKKFSEKAAKSKNKFDDQIIHAISAPVKLLVWYGLIFISFDLYKEQVSYFKTVTDYIDIIPIIIISWAFIRLVTGIEDYLINKRSNLNNDSIRLFSRLIKISLIIAIILGIAQYLGFSISSILTLGGVGGIVIGFAAKDMLSNIFGGLMIQLDKPFSTGDWIRSSEFEGTVEKIGWRMTRIRTFSKNPVYIPNSLFSSIPIETPSRMTNRRVNEVIGLRYDDIDKIPSVVTDIDNYLKANDAIDQSQAVRVFFNYFNASSVDINVYCFTKSIDKDSYQKVKQEILLKISEIIASHGAEIAFPTQTLHIQK